MNMKAPERKRTQIHFFINTDEYDEFREAVEALGYDSVSQFLRACARGAIKRAASKHDGPAFQRDLLDEKGRR